MPNELSNRLGLPASGARGSRLPSLAAWRALALGGMLALAACGGRAKAPAGGEPIQPSDAGPADETPSTSTPAAPDDAATGSPIDPEVGPSDMDPTASQQLYADWLATNVAAAGALELLEIYCGECHSNGDNGAAFASGLSLEGLIAYGLIVPGASEASPLVTRMLDGSMPPDSNRRPSAGDIALIASFIDTLSAESTCRPAPFFDPDTALAEMLADLSSRPAEDRPYLRYLSVVETSDAEYCGQSLPQRRNAIAKLVNSLSTSNDIHAPSAIDATELMYRIDIRDYGWARPIDVQDDGTVDHADGWSAIVANAAPYAVELTGPEASALVRETGTPVPVLSATAFLQAAATGDVYYSLLGIRASIDDTDADLDAEVIDGEKLAAVRRAATRRRSPPIVDVIVSRIPLGVDGDRALWRADMDDRNGASDILDDPLDTFPGDWTQTIIELPNGLHAYAVNDVDGARMYESAPGCTDDCGKPQARHAIGCMGCHLSGVLPIDDYVRDAVTRQQLIFPADDFELILQIYPPAPQFAELVAASNARYLAALQQLGIRTDIVEPISEAYLAFDLSLDRGQAAAELGVSDETLEAYADVLPPTLSPLLDPRGRVARQVFTEAYVQALCVVSATSRNHPASCP
jgi:hypothetical protein